jgi:hypothetical protein
MNHHHQQYRKDHYKIYYRIESKRRKEKMYKSKTRPLTEEILTYTETLQWVLGESFSIRGRLDKERH